MSDERAAVRDYVLGNSKQEQDRLKLQASIVGGWTREFFRSAGLGSGMHVLDIGSGMGDVSLIAAELVGPAGSVTGVERDKDVVEQARKRVAGEQCGASIEFVCASSLNFPPQQQRQFDAVVGRYVLLYQPDAAAVIRHAASLLRPGGILCFHEMDFGNVIQSYPGGTLFDRMYLLLGETFRRAGVKCDAGLHLTRWFLEAGLPWPRLKVAVPVGGEAGSYVYGWVAETLRSLLPRIVQFGLATEEELGPDTLAQRMEREGVERRSQLIGPLQFGAWARAVG